MHCCRSNCVREADETGFCPEHAEEIEQQKARERMVRMAAAPFVEPVIADNFDESTFDPREFIPVTVVDRKTLRPVPSFVRPLPARRDR